MGKALVHAVGDGAVVVQRGEHVLDLVEHVVDAADVQVGLLLAGERGVGEVFGGGRRTHRERGLGAFALRHAGIELADFLFQARLERCGRDPVADLGAGLGQGLDVVDVQGLQALRDALGQVVVGKEVAEGERGGGKAARNPDAGFRQLGDHLPQRRILAADDFHVSHAQLLERQHIGAVICLVSHESLKTK